MYPSSSVPLATYGTILADISSGEVGFVRSGKSFSLLVTFQKELLAIGYDFFSFHNDNLLGCAPPPVLDPFQNTHGFDPGILLKEYYPSPGK